MDHSIKHIVLTPSQAAEKEQILDRIRVNPRGPWVNGKKMRLLTPKKKTQVDKKKI